MKTSVFLILALLTFNSIAKAQLCPGGGTSFTNAVTFDPAWIYGCNTGTSCNGGVHFDNRIACEPVTAIESCAPAPTCTGGITNGSDIWFKFYAAAGTVSIASFQNTSLVIGLQAFSGGPTCGSLTSIGCAVSAGPSSGVVLTLTGLTVGELYYYRMFGSSTPSSQRSGIYCFCGTTGLQNYVLPSELTQFKADNKNGFNRLYWQINGETGIEYVEVQRSDDGRNFSGVDEMPVDNTNRVYSFSEKIFLPYPAVFYRLKLVSHDRKIRYSHALVLRSGQPDELTVVANIPGKPAEIVVDHAGVFTLYNSKGSCIRSYTFQTGRQLIHTSGFSNGVYFLRSAKGKSLKLVILNK